MNEPYLTLEPCDNSICSCQYSHEHKGFLCAAHHLIKKKHFEPLTLEQCKDKVSKKYQYSDWNDVLKNHRNHPLNHYINEAAELYASQFRDRLKELEEQEKTVYLVMGTHGSGAVYVAGCFSSKESAERYCGESLNITSFVKESPVAN